MRMNKLENLHIFYIVSERLLFLLYPSLKIHMILGNELRLKISP